MRNLAPVTLLGLLLAACAAPRPVLYPNPHYNDVGADQAKKDTDECMAKAKEYVKSQKGKTVAKHTGWGAATGAAAGAVAGLFTGDVARGAAEGAAVGGTVGTAQGAYDASNPDHVYKRFVDMCLSEKGYQSAGWR